MTGSVSLALSHVVAGRFTDIGLVVIVKDVVTDLEDDAQVLPELLGLLDLFLSRTGRQRADGSTGFEECCRLLLDHLIVDLF